MDSQTLNNYIRQEIRHEVFADHIKLYLPFYFRNDTSEPLCLVWNNKGVLSDCGRTFKELQKRVGDLTPFADNIKNILSSHGSVNLESGHILTVRNFQTCICGDETYTDYMAGLSKFLRAISASRCSHLLIRFSVINNFFALFYAYYTYRLLPPVPAAVKQWRCTHFSRQSLT